MLRGSLLLPVLLAAACATAGPPPTIVVADKDVQLRRDDQVVTLRTDPFTGRVQEVRRDAFYREFWVKGTDGKWYRIPREDWERAKIGQPLEIRPGLRERATHQPTLGPCLGPDGRWRC